MQSHIMPVSEYAIIHLHAGDAAWGGLLTQFTLQVTVQEERHYATWAGDRFARAMAKHDGVVALSDGQLLGVLFFEVQERVIELTFPWTADKSARLARRLAEAAMTVIRADYPGVPHVRAERQLLPVQDEYAALEAVGFRCHWRRRMQLALDTWRGECRVPRGYRLDAWNIRELDAAAALVFAANIDTLDALLYPHFFGTTPEACRHGLLSILAGAYGPLHPHATQCAFHDGQLAGINLVISEAETAMVIELAVAPAYQGKGVGRALMVHSLYALKRAGVERVELAVTRENCAARRLYESLCFLPCGDFPVCVWPRASGEET